MSEETSTIEQSRLVPINSLTPESKNITIRFKVLRTKKSKIVWSKRFSRPFLITEREIADETGKIILVLWNNDADVVRTGRSYILRDGYIRLRDYSMQIMRGKIGKFIELNETIDVFEGANLSIPFAWKTQSVPEDITFVRTFEGIASRESKGYCPKKEF